MKIFKRKLIVETENLVLSKNVFGYKLIDKNKRHKFKVLEWFSVSSFGAIAGYAVFIESKYIANWYGRELTPYKNNPITLQELIDFVKGINYENL